MAGRGRIFVGGEGDAGLGAADRAAVPQVDLAHLARRWWSGAWARASPRSMARPIRSRRSATTTATMSLDHGSMVPWQTDGRGTARTAPGAPGAARRRQPSHRPRPRAGRRCSGRSWRPCARSSTSAAARSAWSTTGACYVAAADDGDQPRRWRRARVPVGTGLAGRVVASRASRSTRPTSTPTSASTPTCGGSGTNLPTKSYLGVPLVCLGRVIGVLQVDSVETAAFDEEDQCAAAGAGHPGRRRHRERPAQRGDPPPRAAQGRSPGIAFYSSKTTLKSVTLLPAKP